MTPELVVDFRETPASPVNPPGAVPAVRATADGGAVPVLPAIPERIGRFLIREEIGRGSNGVVYAAVDPVLGRDVAIKAIPLTAQQPGQPSIEAGFLQEAKIAAGLNHPSIVTVFDAGKTDGIAYIAMERLKGADLHHWLASNRTMSAESAAALIARVADAVHFAHRRGLIHRDIKPSNIFLGRDMKPKVLDFGIALAQGQQAHPDEPRKLIGTPNYMSPEQALGQPLDARSDVFSIGAILYELITGHRAFDGADIDEILTKVVKIDPPLLSSWRADVSPVMAEIVCRAMAKDPASRYQTAGQLRNDLAAYAGRPVGPATSPPGEPLRPPRAQLHLPGPGALVATGVAVLGLSLTFALWYRSHEAQDSAPVAAAPAYLPAEATAPAEPAAPAEQAAPAAPALAPGATDGTAPEAGVVGAALATPPPVPAPVPAPNLAPTPERSLGQAAPAGGTASNGADDKPTAAAHAPRRSPAARSRVVAAAAPPAPAPVPVAPGTLILAIAPWGEVFVDGSDAGVAPPLSRLSLPPGEHVIEVHNGGFTAYRAVIDVESGKSLTLQHRF
jgi:serine/threonine-protein kinase